MQRSHLTTLVIGVVVLAMVAVISTTLLTEAPTDGFGGPSSRSPDPFVENMPVETDQQPTLRDENLVTQVVASGLALPTSMAFVSNDSAIVIEKNTGSVILVSFGDSTRKELLRLNIANGAEQGLLGIAVADMSQIAGSQSDTTYIFLYLTEADDNGRLLGNRVYRYEWDPRNEVLFNPSLILRLPAEPGPTHNGGKLVVSNQGHLYVVIGDLNRATAGPLQNQGSGTVDDTSVILRVDFDGNSVPDNPFVHYGKEQLSRYYAYGIRNSFGMAIDPVTGTLWMTENGPQDRDELNIVYPGFNSGWSKLTGPMDTSGVTEDDLFFLDGAVYHDPLFTWIQPIGPTDMEFLKSDRLGAEYQNNIFVGDINGGALYFFKVDESRTGLDLSDHPELSDGVAETYGDGFLARFGSFPGGITHLETGPDGLLYVLTFGGNIYRIMPAS